MKIMDMMLFQIPMLYHQKNIMCVIFLFTTYDFYLNQAWCNNMHGLNPLTLGSRVACRPNSNIVLFSFLIICTLTLVMEFMLGCIEHRYHKSKSLMSMLNKMYKELMMLGIISLLLGFIESVDVFQMIFKQELSHNVFLLFEFVHLVIFFLGCFYVLVVIIVSLSFLGFHSFSNYARKNLNITICPFLVPQVFVKEKFALIQKRFILMNKLSYAFDFPMYMTKIFQEEAHEIVEFSCRLVIALWVVCGVLFGLSFFNYGHLGNGGVYYFLLFFFSFQLLVVVLLPICVFFPKMKYCKHLNSHRVSINEKYEEMKNEEMKEEGIVDRRDELKKLLEKHIQSAQKLERAISVSELSSLNDSSSYDDGDSLEEGGEDVELEDISQSTSESLKEMETDNDDDEFTSDDGAEKGKKKKEEEEEEEEEEEFEKNIPFKYFFLRRPKFTWWFLQAAVSMQACYLTFLFIYALPLIIMENVGGENPVVKFFIFVLLLVPFIVTMGVLIAVIPDFTVLHHIESKTNWMFVRKVIRTAIKAKVHDDYEMELKYIRKLERIPKKLRHSMSLGHHH